MRRIFLVALLLSSLLTACAPAAAAPSANVPNTAEAKATQAILEKYMAALNSNNIDAVMALYADDFKWTYRGLAPDGTPDRPLSKFELKLFWDEIWGVPIKPQFGTYIVTNTGERAVVEAVLSQTSPLSNKIVSAPAVAVLVFKDGKIEAEDWYFNQELLH